MPKQNTSAEMPEMEPSSETTQCPECKTKKWPIILLSILVLALTVAIILMLLGVFGSTDEPTQETVVDETEEVIVEEEEEVEEETTQKLSFLETVEFEYPEGWHVAQHYEDIYTYIDLSPEPIRYLDAYGSAPSLVSVKFTTLSPAFEAQALGEVETETLTQGDYTVWHIQDVNDMLSTPSEPVEYEEYLYFYTGEGEGTNFSISFTDYLTETTEDNEGWDTIINSLEFVEM